MINGPKNSYPTSRGWVSLKGELLKCQRISQEDIDEWYASKNPKAKVTSTAAAPAPKPVVVSAPEPVVEAEPVVEETISLEDLMTDEAEEDTEEATDVEEEVLTSSSPRKPRRKRKNRIATAVQNEKDTLADNI
jgi:hypothetical protein